MTPPTDAVLRWIARTAIGGGLAALVWAGLVTADAAFYRRTTLAAARDWAPLSNVVAAPASRAEPSLKRGDRIGVLEVPRLRYVEAVAEGDHPETLKKAIGHLPDTPPPWRPGNAVLAGHRDTHFRALRNIAIGDRLRLRTPRGDFEYRVDDKLIVAPTDVSLLAGSGQRRLTLVTCYPFSYVGNAPQRFIVTAVEATRGAQGTGEK